MTEDWMRKNNTEYTDQMANWVLARPYTMAKSFKQQFPMTGHRARDILMHMQRNGLIEIANQTRKRTLYRPVDQINRT